MTRRNRKEKSISPMSATEQRMREHAVAQLLAQTQWLTADDIAKAIGPTTKATDPVRAWKQQGKIFSVRIRAGRRGKDRYPAYQFNSRMKPKPIIARLLKVFTGVKTDPWKIAAWFGSKNGWLRGRAPMDCLSELKLVIEAAKREMAELTDKFGPRKKYKQDRGPLTQQQIRAIKKLEPQGRLHVQETLTSKSSAPALETLANLVDHNEAQREAHFERVLAGLEMLDPEIVNHAVSVLGDRHRAARWFATPKRVMPNGESPLRAVAR
ncbi:MAG: hypothetical protein HY308_10235, partial [Gammaproteobacteria bacterium]|nr:hypothetical protein [Gammaproteobacteria bacterium]